jgi:pyruvate,orthophosphate dikinase
MQARAIFEAAVEAAKRTGKPVVPEVMVPLIATKAELDLVKASIDAMAEAVARETGTKVAYQVGTMIELPRASLRAGEIAETAEFFSFGTNDLTQDRLRHQPRRRRELSRHLHGARDSRERSVSSPSTARAWRTGADRRRARSEDEGEAQGRHLRRARRRPASVAFCHEIALDYVSCSPFRVPIARLAAAQAALGKEASSEA